MDISPIFFSYSRTDSEFALKLATDLRNAGANIWIDQLNIPDGAVFYDEIEIALEKSGCVLMLLSPKSVASKHVKEEVSYALDQNKRVIPILVKACKIPFFVRPLQTIDFSNDYETGLTRLLKGLNVEKKTEGSAEAENNENLHWKQAHQDDAADNYQNEQQPGKESFDKKKDKNTLSLIGFAVFLILAVFLGFYNKKLDIISSAMYFFMLILLAFASTACLFVALRSHAKYSGKIYNSAIKLVAPAIILSFIIGLGYLFRPQERSFGFTLNVFSATDTTEIINTGNADVFFGTAHWVKKISEGQAVFSEIPNIYKDKEVTIITNAEGYNAKKQTLRVPVNASADIYLAKITDSVIVRGLIKDKKGKAMKDAVLVFADRIKVTSDAYGNFVSNLPFKDGTEVTLRVYIQDELKYDNLVTLSSIASLSVFIDSL